MKRISFNKGKDFYSVTSKTELDYIYSRLNKKTWGAIVDKMEPDFLAQGHVSTTFIEPKTNEIKDKWLYILECYLEVAKEDLVL